MNFKEFGELMVAKVFDCMTDTIMNNTSGNEMKFDYTNIDDKKEHQIEIIINHYVGGKKIRKGKKRIETVEVKR